MGGATPTLSDTWIREDISIHAPRGGSDPDGWEIANNEYCETLITSPYGDTYLANDILSNWGDSPALVWYDNNQRRRHITLVERE